MDPRRHLLAALAVGLALAGPALAQAPEPTAAPPPAAAPVAAPVAAPAPLLGPRHLDPQSGRYVARFGAGTALLTIDPRLQSRLERTLADHPSGGRDPAVLLAMGPGFCSELVLLEW